LPSGAPTAQDLQDWLVSRLAQQLKVGPDVIDVSQPFARYGLDSVEAVSLSADLAAWLGRTLPATLAWDYPTIKALSSHLAQEAIC
jgi:acyl carrier protein